MRGGIKVITSTHHDASWKARQKGEERAVRKQKGKKRTFHKLSNAAVGARVHTVPSREVHATQRHGAHCVTKVVLFG